MGVSKEGVQNVIKYDTYEDWAKSEAETNKSNE